MPKRLPLLLPVLGTDVSLWSGCYWRFSNCTRQEGDSCQSPQKQEVY